MKDKVFAQVYSMIRTFPEGLIPALRLFSEVGYDGVELVGDNTDGLSLSDFQQLLKDLNLKVNSVHTIRGLEDLAFAQTVGAKYLNVGIDPAHVTRDAVLKACDVLNRQGATYRDNGLMAVLHNHADEFRWIAGEEGKTRIYDLLLQHTDPALVNYEFDVGWAALAGVDVVSYVRENPGRFPLIHVKECTRVARTPEETEHFPRRIFHDGLERDPETGVPILTPEMEHELYESRSWNGALGKGIIDWKALYLAADAQGCDAYINEREYYHYDGSDGTNVCCVKQDYAFLRSL